MKNKITFILSALSLCLVFISCRKDGYSVTESGLHYHFYEARKAEQPKLGDILRLHLIYRNSKDSILYDSKVLGDSFLIELVKPSFKGGLEEGFSMMGRGDSASFLVSADSIFDKLFHQPLPANIHKGEILRFDVKLIKIMSRAEMNAYLNQHSSSTAKKESEIINEYLINNKLEVSPVKDGVYYIQFIEGKGEHPKLGDMVTVKYIARSLSGVVYDASDNKGKPAKFILGEGGYLPSFVNAILSMKKGGVTRVVLSSENAYGSKGFGPVPPDSPIVFELELLDINSEDQS